MQGGNSVIENLKLKNKKMESNTKGMDLHYCLGQSLYCV